LESSFFSLQANRVIKIKSKMRKLELRMGEN